MADWKLNRKQIKALAKQVNEGQAKSAPAEKRVKISMTFDKLIKKMSRTPSPKKKQERKCQILQITECWYH